MTEQMHTPTDAQVEAAARAMADLYSDHWECVCAAKRGLDCDCGDGILDDRADRYDERMSRNEYRKQALVALLAASQVQS